MEVEEIIIKVRGIASILKSMSYVEDNVRDEEFALEFLSKELFDCADELTDEFTKIKNGRL